MLLLIMDLTGRTEHDDKLKYCIELLVQSICMNMGYGKKRAHARAHRNPLDRTDNANKRKLAKREMA